MEIEKPCECVCQYGVSKRGDDADAGAATTAAAALVDCNMGATINTFTSSSGAFVRAHHGSCQSECILKYFTLLSLVRFSCVATGFLDKCMCVCVCVETGAPQDSINILL